MEAWFIWALLFGIEHVNYMKAILSYNKEYYEIDSGIFRRIDNNYNNSKK